MGNKESQNNSKLKREYKTLININGDKYEGEILNEERSGYGINYYKNGNKYEGWWENDLENGTGSLFYKDGSLYIGQWANGKENGMGTLYYNFGDKYYGNFIDGKKNGKGLFISRNNNNRFIGTFKNNLKHGKGIMYYHQNKKLSKEIWDNGILVSSQIISFEENEGNENTIKLFSKQNLLLMGFFSGNLNNETNENEKNKNFTLSVAKYFKARIPNNYFDAMNLIIYTSDLLYNNNKIFEWSEKNIITYGINGIKFLQFTGNELINYNIVDVRDTKLILKSIDFLRIFVRLFTDYSEKYELNSHENNFTREIKEGISNNNLIEANYIRTGNRHATMNQMLTSNRNDVHELRRASSNFNIFERNNNLINTNKNSNNENNSTIYTSVNNNRSRRSSIILSNPNNQNYNNIIENVEFTLTKISLTKLLMNSLSLGGFNFYIPFNELKIIKKIGEGAFGEVFLGYWNEKKVAIKKFFFVKKYHERVHQNKINKNLNLKPILIKFIKEINIIGNLRHPNLVLYMGASISNNNNCYLVMEYVDNGNLFNFLHRGKYNKEGNYQKFDLNLTTKIALEIALAIKYLHCRNITHCDLKSINVLLDHNYHVKITDFGVSKIINILYEKGQEIKGKLGTTHWMPPEIMKSYKYEEKSDVFSYGMILYEIITGDIPYYGLFPNQIVGLVADCRKIVQVPEITSNPYLRKIVVECLKYDIDDRPSFEEIIYYLEKVISFLDKRDFDFEDICKFVI